MYIISQSRLALQYIEESSSFIDWQFDCLFICLMFKKCLNKCHDKLAAKHIVLFCLASNKNSITMLHNCSSTNRKSCSHKFILEYKLICNKGYFCFLFWCWFSFSLRLHQFSKCNRLNYNHFVNVIDYITDYI
jgi:hypothetical protein